MLKLIPLLALAACVATLPQITGYRDPQVPIYSNAVLQLSDYAGEWTQAADFAATPCAATNLSLRPVAAGMEITGQLCLAGQLTDVSGTYATTGPGRLQRGTDAPWWVIWADTNLRTLAIGTPDGRFGFILNKGPDLPSDRLNAAREVFDFNGYNPDRLQTF
jgi:apolipoprotein D and lipocalin family protein